MAYTPFYRAAISVAPRRSWGWRRLILAGSGVLGLVVAGALLGRGPILSAGSRANLFSGGSGVESLRNDVIGALRTLPVVSSAGGADRVQDPAPAADHGTAADRGAGTPLRVLAPQSLAAARRLTPIAPVAEMAPEAMPAMQDGAGAATDPAGLSVDQSTAPAGLPSTAAVTGQTSSAPVQPARSQDVVSAADPAPAPSAPQAQVSLAAVAIPLPQNHATTPLPAIAAPQAPIHVAAVDPDSGHGQQASRANQPQIPQIPAVPSYPSVSASQPGANVQGSGILVVTGPVIGVSSPASAPVLHPQSEEVPVGSIHVAPAAGPGSAARGGQGQNSGDHGGDHGPGGRGH